MGSSLDVSVIICTHNRCDLLAEAMESVLSQVTEEIHYELIVVDNNSTDGTKGVIGAFISRGHPNLRYVFESKQGLSNARNAGLEHARAPIVAFTDDDVRVARDWVRVIKRTFDQHPEVAFISGKVLPRWNAEPPSWLTSEHWSALALQDHGDTPFYSNISRPVCLVGASLAIRREVFRIVGNFNPAFARIGASSSDDHEWELRVWNAGQQGLYVPELIVTADVQVERMDKAYHRLWHTGHGVSRAMMRDPADERASAYLFGVPAPMFRQFAGNAAGWVANKVRGNEARAFACELRLRWLRSFVRHRSAEYKGSHDRGTVGEVTAFVRTLVARKVHGPREAS